MQTKTTTKPSVNDLQYLPAYAGYILSNRLDEYTRLQIRFSREEELPLLRYLSHLTEEELFSLTKESIQSNFELLSANKVEEAIQQTKKLWSIENIAEAVKENIAALDITLSTYIKKKLLLHFLKEYATDTNEIIDTITEIDFFLMQVERTALDIYINQLHENVVERSRFIDSINQTIPGALYIFDFNKYRNIYSNEKLTDVIGYSQEELNFMGPSSVSEVIHTEDQHQLKEHINNLKHAKDGEILNYAYRIKQKNGDYRWLRTYETVFKRDEQGNVLQTIAITLDITKQKQVAEALRVSNAEKQQLIQVLKNNEQLYKQAESLANLGNWSWDMQTNKVSWTDQLYKIYGLEPQSEQIDMDKFLSFVHPDDREQLQKDFAEGYIDENRDYTFRIIAADNTVKTLRSLAQVEKNEKGEAVRMIGTEQDITSQQQLLEQLKESDQLYKQAQAIAAIGNWKLDLKTGLYTCSDEMYHIFELPVGTKVTQDDWVGFIDPAEKDSVVSYFNECITNKTSYDKIHTIIVGDGKRKVVHRKGEVFYNKKGEPVSMIGTTQDITEQYNTRVELEENQNFIRKLTDATPSIISSYNINTGKYVFISEGVEKLLGYSRAEVMEKGTEFFLEIVHPEDKEALLQKNIEAIREANRSQKKEDTVVEYTYRLKHSNGRYRWFNTYGTVFDRNDEGEVLHVLNISLDVTTQVEAMKKIEEQEYFIEQIADASPTILYLFDVQKESFVYINREIFFVLGFTQEEVLKFTPAQVIELYHPDDLHLLPERKFSQGKFQYEQSMLQYECRLKNKNGDWCWLLLREIVFKKDLHGKVQQILGAALDISRRKEMEKTLLHNSFQLEQSNASLEEFAYVASHDLKEPLRKISTFGDRLVATQSSKLGDDGKMYLQKVVDASQRMQLMIDDLLSVSMISGNRSFEEFSLQSILEDALQALEYKIEKQNAIIEAENLPKARIVPSQFRQLFQNLLSNSLKFVRPGVQPVIKIHSQILKPSQLENLQIARASSYLKLEFIDNGIGFEKEYSAKIFQIFQRLHGRSEYEGTGIGLAIVKKIVEHHGGVIYATGNPDEGATFTIILPR